MEKYQDLIVTLIKNHRRYQGCESILDDIVKEVTERAKTVIDSIEDETIITKYLTKIVSTAMITVPKEHNICPEVKRRTPSIQQASHSPLKEESIAPQNVVYEQASEPEESALIQQETELSAEHEPDLVQTEPALVFEPEQEFDNEPATSQTDSESEDSEINENQLMESLENSDEADEGDTVIYDSIKNILTFGDDEQSEELTLDNESL